MPPLFDPRGGSGEGPAEGERIFLSLGSNIGRRRKNLSLARSLISSTRGIEEVGASFLYKTSPLGYTPQRDFLNGVVEIRTTLEPMGLWNEILKIEKRMGKKVVFRNGPRTIDIDVLLYGKRVVRQKGLVVPHPLAHLRKFVLAPLAELAPEFVHPLRRRSVAELLRECGNESPVSRCCGW